ncbi:MAG: hypothetical protein ACLFUJ_16240 [Phycisphaerae bacterium]
MEQPAHSPQPNPQIPWEQKGNVLVRYARTWWWVIRRNGRIADAADHPVDWKHAKRFRTITLLLALLPVTLVILWMLTWSGIWTLLDVGLEGRTRFEFPLVGVLIFLGIWSLSAGCLWLLTGLAGLFASPGGDFPEHRQRLGALACYLAAPLAVLSAGLVPIGLAIAKVEGVENLLGRTGIFPESISLIQRGSDLLDTLHDPPAVVAERQKGNGNWLTDNWGILVGIWWLELSIFGIWQLTRRSGAKARPAIRSVLFLPAVVAQLVLIWALPAAIIICILAWGSLTR